jgi:hypothetical protein
MAIFRIIFPSKTNGNVTVQTGVDDLEVKIRSSVNKNASTTTFRPLDTISYEVIMKSNEDKKNTFLFY